MTKEERSSIEKSTTKEERGGEREREKEREREREKEREGRGGE